MSVSFKCRMIRILYWTVASALIAGIVYLFFVWILKTFNSQESGEAIFRVFVGCFVLAFVLLTFCLHLYSVGEKIGVFPFETSHSVPADENERENDACHDEDLHGLPLVVRMFVTMHPAPYMPRPCHDRISFMDANVREAFRLPGAFEDSTALCSRLREILLDSEDTAKYPYGTFRDRGLIELPERVYYDKDFNRLDTAPILEYLCGLLETPLAETANKTE